ncbi:MAG: short-chain dehydrogenase [Maritimibacter sp.]|nr:short-chain dehydrogenase [Maritimibacter sp.]
MPATAIVTGASSGLGQEFARIHAATGGRVILTARREPELLALKQELEDRHGTEVHVFPADLGQPGAAEELYAAVRAAGLAPEILINNAGFGGQGKFVERDLSRHLAMIDVNIKALMVLTYLFGRDMAGRGAGRILNVGSTAGFLPGPQQAAYFASKAFVNSFSQAIDQELRPRGVTCTVLAPGYVETGFASAADMEGTAMVKAGGADAPTVAKMGYDAMMEGRLVKINSAALNFALTWIVPLLPRRMVLRLAERTQSK